MTTYTKDLEKYTYDNYSLKIHGKDIRERNTENVNFDKSQIAEFEQVFESLKGEPKTLKVRNSKEFNIKALINFKAQGSKGDPKLFKKQINTNSGNIYLLIDGSGTMRFDQRAETCRNLTANIMKAIEEIPRINLKAYIYGGSFENCDDLCISEVNNAKECEKITADGYDYGSTPTHNALDFIMKKHENDSGKKLIIVLTDGEPELWNNHNSISRSIRGLSEKLKQETKRACVELESKEFNLFGVGIGLYDIPSFDNCFRNEFINVKNASDIKKHLISKMNEFVGMIR